MINASLLFLSYDRHRIAERTLESYQENGLLDNVREKKAFFQCITEEDRKLADKYDLEVMGLNRNVGISGGFLNLVLSSNSDFVLVLENDWELLRSAERVLQDATNLIEKNDIDVVRLRSRYDYGEPMHSRYAFEGRETESENALRHLLNSVHWTENPDEKFPEYIDKMNGWSGDWYITSSRHANFTNNPCMYRRDWFIEKILPFCQKEGAHIEPEIDNWWVQQDFRIAQGEGLFKHNDK